VKEGLPFFACPNPDCKSYGQRVQLGLFGGRARCGQCKSIMDVVADAKPAGWVSDLNRKHKGAQNER